MMNSKGFSVSKNAVRLVAVALHLLLFAAASWAWSEPFGGQGSRARWHPRRPPAGGEFVGDKTCAQCHKQTVAVHAQSPMALAMEPVANSRVLVANPLMTFRTGPYLYEIKRQGEGSVYKVTDGKEAVALPILYAFGQGKAGQTYVLEYEGAYYESLVSYYNE